MASDALTEAERRLVLALAKGTPREQAYKIAELNQSGASRALRRPRVVAAVRREQERILLTEAAPEALATLRDIMSDKGAPAAARVTAAKTVLDRAGIGESTIQGPEARAADADALRRLLADVDGTLELVERRATVRLDGGGQDRADQADQAQSLTLDHGQVIDPFS